MPFGMLRHVTLHLHRATRTDLLADGLADLLGIPLPDPFAEEVVVVPAKGVERWLTQRLSHRLGAAAGAQDGVCAGVRFLTPHSLVALLTRMLPGRPAGGGEAPAGPYDDPWQADRLAWPVLEAIDESLDEPWCVPVARHLGAAHEGVEAQLRQQRRWSVARRLAGLFASYAVQRPQVLTDWREGRATDGAGAPLPDDLAWQPELWRRVLDRVPASPPDVRHREVLEAVAAGAGDLPDRLSLFGHTRIPRTEIELLGALARAREVHVWLPQPSPALWQELSAEVSAGPVRRRDDDSARLVTHPLLASLGRDTRELQRTLALASAEDREVRSEEAPHGGPGPLGGGGGPTLLRRLQADLRADRVPEPGPVAGDDRSVQIHACHGVPRQVEVLRDVLTGLLEDDPTLQPRDVLVMCPDIDTYAPLVQAAFGLGRTDGAHPAHGLNVRLADRGLMHTNPLLATAATLVSLATGRATASEVLDLAASPPVRHRFGFSDEDVARLTSWVRASGVRWGLRAETREPFHMDRFAENTWAQGVERLLLGVAVPEEGPRVVGTTVPVDDVASGDIDLAGRAAELLSRLESACRLLAAPAPAQQWLETLRAAVLSLASVPASATWQVSQFDRELVTMTGEAATTEIGPADVRTMLSQRLSGRPTRANFRTGTLTVCTMVPMRSVPHRVVCLLGLDDGVFPRSLTVDGDDVLARDPLTGERDPRSEDRQLFLDAVMAATDTLVVTYSGASEHTGQERPPSVPLGELVDVLGRMTDEETMDRVHRRHRLQPFAEANFDGFSFDRAAAAGARALRQQEDPQEFLSGPLPPVGPDLTLDELTAFYRNPARAILDRLEVGTPRDGDEVKDAMPIDLDGLETWSIGDRMVRSVLAGEDPVALCTAELHRGELPPGDLGAATLRRILETAQELVTATSRVHTPDPDTLEVAVDLPDGRRLVGTVAGIHGRHHLLRLTYSRLGAKHLLPAWLDLLAVSAAHPDVGFRAHCLGRSAPRSRQTIDHVTLGPVSGEEARALLADLARVRAEGLRRPWLVPLATGHAWARASRVGVGNEKRDASRAWDSNPSSPVPGEQDDPAFVRLLGWRARLDALGPELGGRADWLWYPLLDRLAEHRTGA